jgi:hypothetical protein
MKINFPSLPQTNDLHREALEVLIQHMGLAKAAIFMSDTLWKPTDYLKIKDRLFADETVDSLYEKVIVWRERME